MIYAPDPRKCLSTGKVRFRTHVLALIALVEVVFDVHEHHPERITKPCRTYFHQECGGFHLTSKPWNPRPNPHLTSLPQLHKLAAGVTDTSSQKENSHVATR